MTDLLLQPMLVRGPNDHDVIADDWIVGRIVLSDASPAETPWMCRWITSSIKAASRRTATKQRGIRRAKVRDRGDVGAEEKIRFTSSIPLPSLPERPAYHRWSNLLCP